MLALTPPAVPMTVVGPLAVAGAVVVVVFDGGLAVGGEVLAGVLAGGEVAGTDCVAVLDEPPQPPRAIRATVAMSAAAVPRLASGETPVSRDRSDRTASTSSALDRSNVNNRPRRQRRAEPRMRRNSRAAAQ